MSADGDEGLPAWVEEDMGDCKYFDRQVAKGSGRSSTGRYEPRQTEKEGV